MYSNWDVSEIDLSSRDMNEINLNVTGIVD
jgi:hypothetical protein